ncbi:MAG: peptide chain release factor N(5)-glutamine methyltransferase [Rickettsiales bacterium]|nr:MAG: peptide chain release factor N(5)-glutamine methyltransferase [Rickettsiales bacterium]
MKVKDVFLNTIKKIDKLDAKILLTNFLDIKFNELYLHFDKDMEEGEFLKLVERRVNNEPVANIIGKKAFWNTEFYVNENVLTPRPDSETLIEAVKENYKNEQAELSFLDLGTGSGCLLLTLLNIYKNSSGIGIDTSDKALEVAEKNGANFKNVKFLKNNWNDGLEEKFDIIISNPPYIPTKEIDNLMPETKIFNPLLALDGGKDGLDCYRYLADNLKKNMKPNCKIFIEIGMGQKSDIISIFKEYSFVKAYKDLANIERVLLFN